MSQVIYQAYGQQGTRSGYAETPRKAATAFFQNNPKSRKASVTEGRDDKGHFVTIYGRQSEGRWPDSWSDITKKTVATLPDVTRADGGPSIKTESETATA